MPFKMTAIIVDDEKPAREEMVEMLRAHPDVDVVAVCRNSFEAKADIEKMRPDVVFLDISLPRQNGFELLAELREIPAVVFVTAHDAYAIQAFEANALDYLLKPVLPGRLGQALDKLRRSLHGSRSPDNSLFRHLFLRNGNEYRLVRLQDVYLVEACGNYIKLHDARGFVLQPHTLKQAALLLQELGFIQVNRTQLINARFVVQVSLQQSRRLSIRLENGAVYYTSTRRLAAVREALTGKPLFG
jgi:two-component system LytT family response regulator